MLNFGTFGKNKCHVILNDLLIKLNDRKLNRVILSRFNKVKEDIKKLESLKKYPDFHYRILTHIHEHHKSNWINYSINHIIPNKIITFFLSVINSEIKNARNSKISQS